MRRRLWWLGGAFGMLLAGCGGPGSQVVPWKAILPAEAPVPTLARPCRSTDVDLGNVWFGGVHSFETVGRFQLRRTGEGVCSLVGFPSVRIDGVGPQRVVTRHVPPICCDRLDLQPVSALRALRSGQRAEFGIDWAFWCGGRVSALEARLPGDRKWIRLPVRMPAAPRNGGIPGCGGSTTATPTYLGVSRFVPGLLNGYPLHPRLVGPCRRLGTECDVYYRVRRGELFRYAVSLTNEGRRAVVFGRCPTFTESLEREETYVLNCSKARPIEPGARRVFAMEIRVPKHPGLARELLCWQIWPGGDDDCADVIVSDG